MSTKNNTPAGVRTVDSLSMVNGNADELVASRVIPSYLKWNSVAVTFSPSILMKEYVEVFAENFAVHFGDTLSEDEVQRYLATLLLMRIQLVNGERYSFDPRRLTLRIPSFWAGYLVNVGRCTDDGLGVELYPQPSDELKALAMPEREFRLVSEKLGRSANLFSFANELPKDRKGNFDFMSMQCIQDHLVSHKADVHPSVAFASGFMSQAMAEQIFYPMVSYGSISSLRSIVGGLV